MSRTLQDSALGNLPGLFLLDQILPHPKQNSCCWWFPGVQDARIPCRNVKLKTNDVTPSLSAKIDPVFLNDHNFTQATWPSKPETRATPPWSLWLRLQPRSSLAAWTPAFLSTSTPFWYSQGLTQSYHSSFQNSFPSPCCLCKLFSPLLLERPFNSPTRAAALPTVFSSVVLAGAVTPGRQPLLPTDAGSPDELFELDSQEGNHKSVHIKESWSPTWI